MAKKKSIPEPAVAYSPEARKSTARISCPPGSGKVKGYGVGDKVQLGIVGKVKSVRADEYEECMEVELSKVASEEPRSLTRALRNRKMKNGQYA